MKTRLNSALLLAAAFSTFGCSAVYAANHDQHPRAISQPEPSYAFELRKAGIEGAVLLSFTVTAQGNVSDLIVVESTDRVFESPALDAVKKWQFTPAMYQGRAASVPAMQLVTFKSTERNSETPTLALVNNLKPRLPAYRLVAENATSTSPCYCGSGQAYNACHGSDAFRRLASEGKLITGALAAR